MHFYNEHRQSLCSNFYIVYMKRIETNEENKIRYNIHVFFSLFIVFMFTGLSINKQAHILYGNRNYVSNKNYRYLVWNCARGFLSKEKIEDIHILVQKQNIHIVCISEIDLCVEKSSLEEIEDLYHIDGYRIMLQVGRHMDLHVSFYMLMMTLKQS